MRADVIRLCLAVAVLYAGCRGVAAGAPVTATSRRITPPSAAQRPAGEAGGMLAAVNAQRAQRRLPPLGLDPRLTQASLAHARDLARTGRFDHRGSDGSRVSDRVTRTGYRWSLVEENLAKTRTASARAVVEMWMNSRGHRANMLNRQCTQMGMAHVRDVWVLVLARPR